MSACFARRQIFDLRTWTMPCTSRVVRDPAAIRDRAGALFRFMRSSHVRAWIDGPTSVKENGGAGCLLEKKAQASGIIIKIQ